MDWLSHILETNAMKANMGDGTASLEKAMDILDALGSAPQGLSQVELARRLELPGTTLYRLLATLVARGMARRDPLRRGVLPGVSLPGTGPQCLRHARSGRRSRGGASGTARPDWGNVLPGHAGRHWKCCRWSAAMARTAIVRSRRWASASHCTAPARARQFYRRWTMPPAMPWCKPSP